MIKINISYETQAEYRDIMRRFLSLLPEQAKVKNARKKGRYYHVYVSYEEPKQSDTLQGA